MFGRRSHQRFTISAPSEGTLQTLRDVLVERLDREQLIVVSRHAGIVGQNLTLEFAGADRAGFDVRVTESRPVMADGAVRHRLTLRPARSDDSDSGDPPVDVGISGAMLAVLTHRLAVRILNCSAAGCLLDSNVRVEKATIGSLRLRVNGHEFVDDVQVVRCQPVHGSSSYLIGLEFLWIVPPTRRSFRRGINIAGGLERADVLI